MKELKKLWNEKPLTLILFVAAFFRLIAVLFSKGYGMHDDHFLVIEAAQSWVDGADYNNWLPSATNKTVTPSGHSLLYPGLHYLLLKALQFCGMYDAQLKMYVVRFLHAAWSLLIVYLGFKIVLKAEGIKAAKVAGGLLAVLFFMPMMSVRNLVEFVCIPPLLYATWLVLKNESNYKVSAYILAGLMLSLSFNIRFQTAIFIFGFGFALVLQMKWKETLWLVLGFLIGLGFVQATTDMIIWHKPFMELSEYVRYNLENSDQYPNSKWYTYLLLIGGILIPPISIFLVFGFMRSWRKHLILFLPTFMFFVFHSYFPNKQERFILPAIPFIIVLGAIGWNAFFNTSNFWKAHQKLYRGCWLFFFTLNTIPLLFISAAYSHRSRVEAMVYLSTKNDLNNIIIEESNHDYFTLPPRFYLGNWKSNFYVTSGSSVATLVDRIKNSPPDLIPNYVVFNQPENLESRVSAMKSAFPTLVYQATIEPGFIDEVMHYLNKRNANFTSYIYKIEK